MGSDRPETVYCSACGEALASSANYCWSCGTAAESTATDERSRRRSATGPTNGTRRHTPLSTRPETPDRDALERRVASAARDDWELEHDFGDHAIMVRRTFGSATDHLLVATVTVWWTMGLGNALYGAYHYVSDADRLVVRAEQAEKRSNETTDDGRSQTLGRLAAALCWLGAAVFATGASLAATSVLALAFVGLAGILSLAGVALLPSVQQRLDRRHSVVKTGRVHSVDERAVTAPDKPCSLCADTIDRGVERTYREEQCLFGIPLSVSAGRNYYCRQCANAERTASVSTARGEQTASTEHVPTPDLDRQEATPNRDREPPDTTTEADRDPV